MYDVVEVIATPSDVPGVAVGDLGTVLTVHEENGAVVAYEVECVLPDGRSKWVGTFQRRHLRYRIDQNTNAEPGAAPNGGPTAPVDDSSVTEGPPSVS